MKYAEAGVDYDVLDEFKRACMVAARATSINLYQGERCKDSDDVRHMLRLMSQAQAYAHDDIS